MSKKLLVAVPLVVLLLGLIIFGVTKIMGAKKPTAGLKVEASPNSLVFIDNKQVGETPLEKSFTPGEVTVKIIPTANSDSMPTYQTKVKLIDKVYTVIRREFGKTELESAGEIVSLQPQSGKTASLAVVTSSPDSASVSVDGQPQGFTPLLVSTITEGEHQIVITAPGFAPRTVSAQALSGYKLTINAKLAALSQEPTPEATPSSSPAASPSAAASPAPTTKATPTATPKVTVSPTPTKAATTSAVTPTPAMAKPYVQILSTPVGFLRVRSGPGTSYSEVAQVKPGENYALLSSQTDWYQIKGQFTATTSGWISSQYAKKYE